VPPTPIALVLSGGGARAAYQVGALTALAEVAPSLRLEIITGVSAGAINAVALAGGRGPLGTTARVLLRDWERLRPRDIFTVRPFSLLGSAARFAAHAVAGRRRGRPALRGLLDSSPLGRYLNRRVRFAGIADNLAQGRLRAVALSATNYADGATVTFVQGADRVPTWARARRYAVPTPLTVNHVLASSAIPFIFPAVSLPGGYFGDGSVRQAAPLAPAIHLGARGIIAIGMRASAQGRPPVPDAAEYPSSAEVLGLLLHSVFVDALDADAERLRRTNETLSQIPHQHRAATGLREVALLLLQPSRDLGAMARGYAVHLPPVLAAVMRAMGARRARAADFVSYLMFEQPFTGDLLDLGYHDTLARRSAIETFMATDA